MGISWIFLDVGNVLLDEDPLTYRVFVRHVEAACRARAGLTFRDVLAAREDCAVRGSKWPLYEAVLPILGEEACALVWEAAEREVRERFAELSPPVAGAGELVRRLAGGHRLGVIANQGAEARERFASLGWLEAFDVVALSEEVGRHKPDLALFAHAIEQAGAAPGDCLMIGDRLDNDIAPAAALGMKTAWVRWPDRTAKGWRPAEPEAIAYLESLQRLSPVGPEHERPTLIVDRLDCLHDAILGETGNRP